jgi:hypothetical protein
LPEHERQRELEGELQGRAPRNGKLHKDAEDMEQRGALPDRQRREVKHGERYSAARGDAYVRPYGHGYAKGHHYDAKDVQRDPLRPVALFPRVHSAFFIGHLCARQS